MTQLVSALRTLARDPLGTSVAVLTLALGLGVNAAVFSVVQAVLLRSLPFSHAERLTLLFQQENQHDDASPAVSPADYFDWRRLSRSYSGLTAYSISPIDSVLTGKGEPRIARQLPVDGNFFDLLQVRPAQGEALRQADSLAPEAPVAVLSDHLWRELGSNPRIVGQSIVLNGVGYQVRGVMPAGFSYPNADVDLWVPILWPTLTPGNEVLRRYRTLRVIGALRPGTSAGQARAELKILAAGIARAHPETHRNLGADLMPLRDWLVRNIRTSLLILWATSALVLLIACANVAGLQILRGLSRARELATRVALGAPRGALLRRSFTEVLLLAAMSGALGFFASSQATAALIDLFPGELPRAREVAVDSGVALFTALITVGAALLCGLLPTFHATRRVVADALKLGGPATPTTRRPRSLIALIVVESALTAMLLLGVSFLVRSLVLLQRVELGFQPRDVLTLDVALPWNSYKTEADLARFYQGLLASVQALPGVEAAAITDAVPLTGLRWIGTLQVEGRSANGVGIPFHHRVISRDYFRTFGVPILRGGSVPDEERPERAQVVINQALAERCFGTANPLGRRVRFLREGVDDSGWLTVAGVVGAERIEGLAAEPSPDLFEPYSSDPERWTRLAVRSTLPREGLLRELKRVAAALDPRVPLAHPHTMEEVVDAATANERFLLALLSALALLAVVLAGVGIFAVTAHSVARRQREIGIRLALGATQPQVQGAIVRESMRVVALGGILGLVPALGLIRLLRHHLYGIAPTDAEAIVLSALALIAATLLPAYLAARRALRIGPAWPLREG